MIFAKITPEAIKPIHQNPFTINQVTGSYMMATATPYNLGASLVNFSISYGNIEFNEFGSPTKFTSVLESSIDLSGSDLNGWGTDDTVILSILATREGTTATEFLTVADNKILIIK
jgi:hypothetical protein